MENNQQLVEIPLKDITWDEKAITIERFAQNETINSIVIHNLTNLTLELNLIQGLGPTILTPKSKVLLDLRLDQCRKLLLNEEVLYRKISKNCPISEIDESLTITFISEETQNGK